MEGIASSYDTILDQKDQSSMAGIIHAVTGLLEDLIRYGQRYEKRIEEGFGVPMPTASLDEIWGRFARSADIDSARLHLSGVWRYLHAEAGTQNRTIAKELEGIVEVLRSLNIKVPEEGGKAEKTDNVEGGGDAVAKSKDQQGEEGGTAIKAEKLGSEEMDMDLKGIWSRGSEVLFRDRRL